MRKPANEADRLARLRAYGILDTKFDRHYHDLAELAAGICEAPFAVISLVDEDRLWFKATHQLPVGEVSRSDSICAHTILKEGHNLAEDLLAAPEYASLPHVAGPPHLRAYLGVPLVSPEGFAIGTLAALDTKPRGFSEAQVNALSALARQVVAQLELASANRALAASQETLKEERERFKTIVEDLHEIVFRADLEGDWTYLNPAWEHLLGYDVERSLGTSMFTLAPPEERDSLRAQLMSVAEGRVNSIRPHVRFLAADGTEKVFELFAKRGSTPSGTSFLSGTLTDLTILLATHARALGREEDIRSFYSSSPFYMGVAEVHGNDLLFLSVNPAAQRLLKAEGYKFPALSSAIGMREEVAAYWREKYAECTRAGGRLSFETGFGEGADQRWLRVYMSQVGQSENGTSRYSFITADITEEKFRQDLLERQRNLLETVSEHVGDVIWMAELPKGDIIFVSKAYERLWGQSRESLLRDRDTFLRPIHPDDRPRVIRALPSQPSGTYEQIYRVLSPTGERWVRDRAFVVRNAGGEAVQLVGIASDITEVRNQEETVRRAKQNLELVISYLPLAICVFDSNGLREFVNEPWTKLFGWTQDEVAGTPISREMFPDEATTLEAREFSRRSGESREFTVRTKTGETKHCFISVVKLPQGKTMTAIRDLTHERTQAKLIEEQRQTMIESARLSSLGEMAAGVAHEINNPLAIIQGSADLVLTSLEHGGLDEERLKRAMERISSTVNRIAKIITGLRSFARDGRKDPLLPASLKTIIGEALELCQTRFRNNGVELHLDLPEQEVIVAARAVQLAQLIVNLLNNSFDAVSGQSTKRVEITLRSERGRVFLSVLDNGPGVPEDLREKIMQPFFTTKAPGKGTGLGLSLSRSIVEDHGGQLVAKTRRGMTCFEAELPEFVRPAQT